VNGPGIGRGNKHFSCQFAGGEYAKISRSSSSSFSTASKNGDRLIALSLRDRRMFAAAATVLLYRSLLIGV
jgi:hypothetical protein